jgi:hypothetical protein
MRHLWPLSCAALLVLLSACGGAVALLAAAEPKREEQPQKAASISPGEKAQVSMFGVRAEGSKFVYVLDRSGSMGDPKGKSLAAAKAELIASLEKLDTVHQFQIIVYNERPRVFNPTGQPGRLAFGTEQNKTEVRKFLESITPDGGTAHEEALVTAIRMHPDAIFLLTDGDDPQLTPRELARIDRLGAGIVIHTIEFGSGPRQPGENFLTKLARQSGGEHAYVDSTKLK